MINNTNMNKLFDDSIMITMMIVKILKTRYIMWKMILMLKIIMKTILTLKRLMNMMDRLKDFTQIKRMASQAVNMETPPMILGH